MTTEEKFRTYIQSAQYMNWKPYHTDDGNRHYLYVYNSVYGKPLPDTLDDAKTALAGVPHWEVIIDNQHNKTFIEHNA